MLKYTTFLSESPEAIKRLTALNTQLYIDSVHLNELPYYLSSPLFSGVTTNPSLLKSSNIADYQAFAKQLLELVETIPVSFGVVSDELEDIRREAKVIHSWADNTVVKIPVVTTKGISTRSVITDLAQDGVTINVTAIMTESQIETALSALSYHSKAYLSVFAGRVADTGRCPEALFKRLYEMKKPFCNVQSLWASVREVYNIFQAERSKVDVITLNDSTLKKLPLLRKNLEQFSQETVEMFHRDALSAGYHL